MASQSDCEAAGPEPLLTCGTGFLGPPAASRSRRPCPPCGQRLCPEGCASTFSLVCTEPLPRLGMAWPLATHAAKPVLGRVHAPRGHSDLAPNPAPVLCPRRCPRPPPTSWPTVRPTSGRTRSSSPCLRQKTPSERRSSSAPSSDAPGRSASFPVSNVRGDPHARSFRGAPSRPCPARFTGQVYPLVVFIPSIPRFLFLSSLFSFLAKRKRPFCSRITNVPSENKWRFKGLSF